MQYNFLDPQKQIKVSKICLGTMTWGYQNSEAEAHEQIEYSIAQGINFLDTAEVYAVPPSAETYGKTETYIGTWLAKKKVQRDSLVIASKMVGPNQAYIRGGAGIQAKDVSTAIDGSLKRLQTDYLDLYQIHWPQRKVNYFGQYNYNPANYNPTTTQEEIENIHSVLQELQKAIQQGKISHIGVSNETPWGIFQYKQLAEKHNLPNIITIQNVYSLISRAFDLNLSETCMKNNVGLLAYSPLAGGLLSGKYRNNQKPQGARFSTWGYARMDRYDSPTIVAAIGEYAELAEAHNMTPTQLALAFVNERPFLTSNIIGATSMQQLKENIASLDITLNDEIRAGIDKIFSRYRNPAA